MFNSTARKNFGFYLGFHVARYIFPLVVTPFLAHALLKENFGQYAVINSCIWSTVIFMDFGFYIYGVNRVASADTMSEVNHEASSVISAKLALLPVFLIAYGVLVTISGEFARAPVACVLGAFSGIGSGATMAWYFQGRQRGGMAVMLESIPQLFQMLLFLVFVRKPEDLTLTILIQSIAPYLSIILSIAIGYREGLRLRVFKLWSQHVKIALVGATPFFIERVCFSLYTALVPTMIVMLANVQEAATYSIADKAMMFLGTLPGPLAQTLMPMLTRIAKDDNRAWRLPITVCAATTLFCCCAAFFVYLTFGYVVGIFFAASYQAAVPTAHVFCIAAVFSSICSGVANFILVPRNAGRILIWSALSALIVAALIQLELIPLYGSVGAAWARVGAEATTALILTTRAAFLFRSSRKQQLVGMYSSA